MADFATAELSMYLSFILRSSGMPPCATCRTCAICQRRIALQMVHVHNEPRIGTSPKNRAGGGKGGAGVEFIRDGCISGTAYRTVLPWLSCLLRILAVAQPSFLEEIHSTSSGCGTVVVFSVILRGLRAHRCKDCELFSEKGVAPKPQTRSEQDMALELRVSVYES